MSYLQEYYKRNAPAALAHQMKAGASDLGINGEDGNGLAALVNLVSCFPLSKNLAIPFSFYYMRFDYLVFVQTLKWCF